MYAQRAACGWPSLFIPAIYISSFLLLPVVWHYLRRRKKSQPSTSHVYFFLHVTFILPILLPIYSHTPLPFTFSSLSPGGLYCDFFCSGVELLGVGRAGWMKRRRALPAYCRMWRGA